MDIQEMLSNQIELRRHHPDWDNLEPATAPKQLLWGIGEIGEVIDVVKKFGEKGIMNDPVIRRHMMEEVGDVLMYLWDTLLCYGITAEEFEEVYRAKCAKNLGRNYGKEQEAWRNEQAEKQAKEQNQEA